MAKQPAQANTLQKQVGQQKAQQKQVTLSEYLNSNGVQRAIANAVGNNTKEIQRFIANILSATAANPQLNECDNKSLLTAALLASSVNMTLAPQLGLAYVVPFKVKEKNVKDVNGNWTKIPEHYEANFILGYKGFMQLAARSGQYRKINVAEIKEGELRSYNPITGDVDLQPIMDENKRLKAKTIGYYAYFEYLNGYTKSIYWSYEKMLDYADRYSQAFNKETYEQFKAGKIADKDLWKVSSFWYKDFDSMAKKTLIRQLLSKEGALSIELVNVEMNDKTSGYYNETAEFGVGKTELEEVAPIDELQEVEEIPAQTSQKETKDAKTTTAKKQEKSFDASTLFDDNGNFIDADDESF